MRAFFRVPTLPRNPVLRLLLVACTALVILALLAVGLVVGVGILVVAAIAFAIQQWRVGRKRTQPDPSIIDGEFTIVTAPRARLPRQE